MLKNKYFWLILILGLIIRLRGFTSHFLLSSDTARDILTARGALLVGSLPWVGSFSSAGPFVFGPNWYWLLAFTQIVSNNNFWAPWIFMLLISLFFIIVMIKIGVVISGKKLGLLMGLVTAVSPAAVALSAYPTQHAMIEIFSGLALLGFVCFIKFQKMRFASLMSLGIGAALAFHYQAINMLFFFPVIGFYELVKYKNIKRLFILIFVCFLGLLFFLWPLFLWDSSRNFLNFERLVYYFRVGQYQIWVPNRWLTYLFNFWPQFLGKSFGGNEIFGGVIGVTFLISLIFSILKKKITKLFTLPIIVLFAWFLIMRYFRGERYDGYMVYFQPLLILIISFGLINIPKIFSILLGFILIFSSMSFNMPVLDWNNDYQNLVEVKTKVKEYFKDEKVAIYANGLGLSNVTYCTSLVFNSDDNGKLIGISYSADQGKEIAKFTFQKENFVVVDLMGVGSEKLTKQNNWYNFSTVAVFDDVQNWWRKGL